MHHVAALYKFTEIKDPKSLKAIIHPAMKSRHIYGTLICAPEGINGTISGAKPDLDWLVATLGREIGLNAADIKWSTADKAPFKRQKFKLKPEIVTRRLPGVDAVRQTGEFVAPEDWNKIVDNPDIPVIDTRNFYETQLGSFEGAIDPGTESFTDFPAFIDANFDPDRQKDIAMFCTGGIRCEKASAYLRHKGFRNVYQLHGGILKYLEKIPEDQSRWRGECFVFDDRVSLSHGLKQGETAMCWGCGLPLMAPDQDRPEYEDGVSCHRCYDATSDDRKRVLRERHARIMQAKQTMEAKE